MPQSKIFLDDVLKEISRLNDDNPEGWTVAEFSAHTGMAKHQCREKIAELIAAGKAKCNGRARRMAISGMHTLVPIYVLTATNSAKNGNHK